MAVPCVFDVRRRLPDSWADSVMGAAERIRAPGHVTVGGEALATFAPWTKTLWTSWELSEMVSLAADASLAADDGSLDTDLTLEVVSGRGSRVPPVREAADFVVLMSATIPERSGGGRVMAEAVGRRRDVTGWPGEATLVCGGQASWEVTPKLSWVPRVMVRMAFRLVVPASP